MFNESLSFESIYSWTFFHIILTKIAFELQKPLGIFRVIKYSKTMLINQIIYRSFNRS